MLKIESYLDRSLIKWQINQYTDIWDIRPFSVTSLKYALIIDVQLTSEVTHSKMFLCWHNIFELFELLHLICLNY